MRGLTLPALDLEGKVRFVFDFLHRLVVMSDAIITSSAVRCFSFTQRHCIAAAQALLGEQQRSCARAASFIPQVDDFYTISLPRQKCRGEVLRLF
jgi:hypothetical protein